MSAWRSGNRVNADAPPAGPFGLTEAELRADWTAPAVLASISIVLMLIGLLAYAVAISGGAS